MRVEIGMRRAPRARLACLTPGHQYPTGVVLSLERRIALLEWAGRANAWVVEDDYDGEFRYAGQPLTTLASLDPHGRVLYVGTLSKATFVSLRLAYAVVPEELVESLASLRTQLDGLTPALSQMTAWPDNPAGLHLVVRHPESGRVRALAAASSLDLALLSSYRIRPAHDDGLFLRFGGLDPASLRAGIAALVAAADATSPPQRFGPRLPHGPQHRRPSSRPKSARLACPV